MSQTYVMPAVSVGDVVLWRHNRTSPQPAPAVVTNVGTQAISLFIIPGESRAGIPRDGVRHEGDPALNTVLNDAGVWSETVQGKRLAALEVAVGGIILREQTDTRPAKK